MISIKRSSSRVSGGATTGSQRTAISQSTKTMTKCGKCCYYFRQVTTFLFSHIGLGTLLLGYALMGAFTFQALESDHEQLQREQMRQTRDLMIMELSEMTNRSAILKFENWTEMTERILRKFEMKFLDAVKHQGYDGNEEMAMAISQWSFSGALLYSIIVITTIGYGNVAPRTHWGKIVTILYAIIGIPLMLFCLSNIGHTMAHSFKFIYWKCCCYLCVKPKKAQRKKRRRIRRKIRKHRRNQRNQAAAAMMIQTTQSPMYMAPREEVGNYHQQHSMRASIPLKHSHSFNHNSNLLSSNLDLEKQRKPSPFLIRSLSNRSTINMDAATATATDTSSMVTSVNTTPRRSFATDPAPMVNDNENHIIDGGLQLPQQSNYHFNNSNTLQLPQQPPQMQRKSPILARSLSARYHNELSKKGQKPPKTSKPQPSSTVMIKNQSNQTLKPYRKTTMNVPPVICNKYASNSDEFIDIVYQFDPEETRRQLKTIQKQQQQSMVRFQPTNSSMSLLDSQQQVPGIFPRGTTVSSSLSSANIPSHHREFRRSISVFESPASLNAAAPPPSPKSLAPQQQPPSFEMNNIVNTCPVDGPGVYQPFPLLLNDDHDDYSDLSESFDSDSSDDSDIQEKNIPITVCLTLVISYICGGAWFFSASEEWTFLDASYFCFITLSTIGFGDLVPGRTVLSTPEDGQMTLAICALYLLFGMALLAMSLNLVKEKVLETVRIIGERVGILVNDEDEDNY